MAIIEESVKDSHPKTTHVARKFLATLSDSLDRARDHVRTQEELEPGRPRERTVQCPRRVGDRL
jgi:hypothetical protein